MKANYLASPPLVVAYALAGRMDVDLTTEPLGHDPNGDPSSSPTSGRRPREVQETIARRDRPRDVRSTYAERLRGRRRPGASCRSPTGEPVRLGARPRPTCAGRRTSTGMTPEPPARSTTSPARAASSRSATRSRPTTSRRPARSSSTRPPARTSSSTASSARTSTRYGSRRGNHEVMVRGTFANVRLRNQLVPGSEGTWTAHLPDGRGDDDLRRGRALPRRGHADDRARRQGVRLRLVARLGRQGPEPARRPAVIAESYERIHRSNLLMMGILPLQFLPGESRELARPHRPRGVLGHRRRERRGARGHGERRRQASSAPSCGSTRRASASTCATAASSRTSCAACSCWPAVAGAYAVARERRATQPGASSPCPSACACSARSTPASSGATSASRCS